MAATNAAKAQVMATLLAERIKERRNVVDLYARQWGHVAQLWLFIDVEGIEPEQAFRALKVELFDEFPETYFDFRVINVRRLGGLDRRSIIPADARSILCSEHWTP